MRPLLSAFCLLCLLPLGATAQDKSDAPEGRAVAVFAGGCFWCMEPPYDKIPGVMETLSGYGGGSTANPTYEQVSAGGTGHAEALKVIYDPAQVSYDTLLETYWRNIDPFDGGGQFCDRGTPYRPAIFPQNEAQRAAAEASKAAVSERFGRPVAVTIETAPAFYEAEEYHQDYYEKNPLQYRFYRWSCGRDDRLDEVWGDAPT